MLRVLVLRAVRVDRVLLPNRQTGAKEEEEEQEQEREGGDGDDTSRTTNSTTANAHDWLAHTTATSCGGRNNSKSDCGRHGGCMNACVPWLVTRCCDLVTNVKSCAAGCLLWSGAFTTRTPRRHRVLILQLSGPGSHHVVLAVMKNHCYTQRSSFR